jgi:hypothetical protein
MLQDQLDQSTYALKTQYVCRIQPILMVEIQISARQELVLVEVAGQHQ